jgi:hypothetical protein
MCGYVVRVPECRGSETEPGTATMRHTGYLTTHYTGCFKKSFTTLKAYRNLYRGHTPRFELSKCSKTHRVLPRIVIRNCFDLFFRFFTVPPPSPLSQGPMGHTAAITITMHMTK